MKNKGDKTMKKVLLTSAVALAAFSAVSAVSAADNYVRKDPGIRGFGSTNNPNSKVEDKYGHAVTIVKQVDAEVKEDADGVRHVAAEVQVQADGSKAIVETNLSAVSGKTIGTQRIVLYSDGSTSSTFTPSEKADAPATNPYDVRHRIGKDGKPLPEVYSNGTHVRVHVKDKQGNAVSGVEVSALIYKSKEAYLAGEAAVNVKHTEVGVTDAAGDVEFAVAQDGYVLFRVDNAPRGYFVPQKMTLGTELDAEEVTQNEGTMFVTGVLEVEKTDTYNVARTEWVQGENGWHYFDNNKQATGWKQIDGKWYFFNAEGVMQKWWVKDGNTWYYLNGSGAMETGWLQDGGKWYYLENSGAMKASQWFEVAGKWYYVDGSGALAVNTTVGGYTVNGNGEWVK